MSNARDSSIGEPSVQSFVGTRVMDAEAAQPSLSAGGLLRQAREAAGLHIAALAVSLKVPVKKLEALEADRFDLLLDAVFVRALASSVCRNLKIDAAPILEKLPRTGSPKLAYESAGMNTPFTAPGDRPGPSIWTQVSRPAVLAGLVLVLGALVLILLPSFQTGVDLARLDTLPKGLNTSPTSPMASSVDVAGTALTPTDSAPSPTGFSGAPMSPDASATMSGSALAQIAAAAAPSQSSLAVTAANDAALVPRTVPASAASVASPAPSTGIVVFTAKGVSWVEVTDSKGVVVLRRTLSAGEVVGASGLLPLSAVVGRADATTVQIRGNTFDLATVAKDNVARFEVK